MATPPKIFKQSKNPKLNSTNTATVGDIWVDLNDAPATVKTLVAGAGAMSNWVLKKSEILGSEILLSGQTAKTIESDDDILFKLGGSNRFKISSSTVPGGANRIGDISPNGADTATSAVTWRELSVSNPLGEINTTPVPQDSYSRERVTNFSDQGGGGFVFNLGEEQILSLRPFRIPNISYSANLLTGQPTPLSGQVVIGDPEPKYPDSSNLQNSEKLVVNGNLKIGNSTVSNFISFRGTWGDGGGTNGHTYIGERLRTDYPPGSEGSELILFKGNDALPGVNTDRIRYIAATHVFQTFEPGTTVAGTFNEIATTSSIQTRFNIAATGEVYISKSLDVQTTCSVGGELVSWGSTVLHNSLTVDGTSTLWGPTSLRNADVRLTAVPTVSSAANLYIGGDGRIYKSGVNLDDAANAVGTVRAYGHITVIETFPYTATLSYGSGISSIVIQSVGVGLGGMYNYTYRANFSNPLPDSNYVVLFPDVAGMDSYTGAYWYAARIIAKNSLYFDFSFPYSSRGSPSGAFTVDAYPFEFAIIR